MEPKATDRPAQLTTCDVIGNDHVHGVEREVSETKPGEELLSGLMAKSSRSDEVVTYDQGGDAAVQKFSAVDKGYSWVVMIATFGLQFLMVGYFKSLGVLFVELQSRLGSSSTETTFVVATMEITSCISAPLVMVYLVKRTSPRMCCLIGSLFLVVGITGTAWFSGIELLCLSHGVLVGISIGLCGGTPFVALVQYFENQRAIATGISTCGASLGGVAFPLLFRRLMDEYGYQGGVLMMAGVQAHALIFSILLVPFEQYSRAYARAAGSNTLAMDSLETSGLIAQNRQEEQSNNNAIQNKYNGSIELELTELTQTAVKNNGAESAELKDGRRLDATCSFPSRAHSGKRKPRPGTCSERCSSCCRSNHLLRSVTFWLLAGFYFCASTGSVLGQTFLPVLAEEKGLTKDEGAFLVSVMNVLDIPAHLIPGAIINFRLIRPGKITIVPLLAVGIMGNLTALLHSYSSMLSISIIYGLFLGVYYAVQPLIIVELLGAEHFSTALGIYFALTSLGPAISYPFCGALKDMSQSSTYTYHYIGSLHITAALLIAASPLAKRYDFHRKTLPQP